MPAQAEAAAAAAGAVSEGAIPTPFDSVSQAGGDDGGGRSRVRAAAAPQPIGDDASLQVHQDEAPRETEPPSSRHDDQPTSYRPRKLYGEDVTGGDENADERIRFEKQQALDDLKEMEIPHSLTMDDRLEDIEFRRNHEIQRATMEQNVSLAKNLVLKGGAMMLEGLNKKFLGNTLPIKGLKNVVTSDVN